MQPRIIALSILGLLVVLAAGGWLYWHRMADGISNGVEAWVEDQKAQGVAVGFDPTAVEGFPVAFDLDFDNAVVAGVTDRGTAWRVALPPVSARAPAWAPQEIAADFPGEFVVQSRHPNSPIGLLEATFATARAAADASFLAGGRLKQGSLRIGDAVATLPLRGGLEVAWGAIEADAALEWSDSGVSPQEAAATLRLVETQLPAGAGGVLGDKVERLLIDAVLRGAISPGPPERTLAAWRDRGGLLDVSRLEIQWGPLLLVGAGPITLDENLQPNGTLKSEVQGFKPLFDALADVGMVKRDMAEVAKQVLGFLARRDAPDGPLILDLDITLRDGELFLSKYRLLRYGRIDWQ